MALDRAAQGSAPSGCSWCCCRGCRSRSTPPRSAAVPAMRTWVDFRRGLDDERAFQALATRSRACPWARRCRSSRARRRLPVPRARGLRRGARRVLLRPRRRRPAAAREAQGEPLPGRARRRRAAASRRWSAPAWCRPCARGALPGSETLADRAPAAGRAAARGAGRPAAPTSAAAPRCSRTLDELAADPRTLHLAASLALADAPPDGAPACWSSTSSRSSSPSAATRTRGARFLANLLYAASVPRRPRGGRADDARRLLPPLRAPTRSWRSSWPPRTSTWSAR